VITFGLNAHNVPVAVVGAAAALAVVLGLAVVVRQPLTKVPENTLKYVVGLLLTTFGTIWSVAGLGIFSDSGDSLPWAGHDLAIPVILVGWFALSRLLIAVLRVPSRPADRPSLETTEV
jgi:uncharacterized membrane protein